MDTRTQTSSIYGKESAHPQALACATCELRSTALFGVLDQGFYTCCDGFSITRGPTMSSGCFGVTRSVRFSALRREGALTLTPRRSAVRDRVAFRAALLAEGAA